MVGSFNRGFRSKLLGWIFVPKIGLKSWCLEDVFNRFLNNLLGGVSKYFLFSSLPGEMIQVD